MVENNELKSDITTMNSANVKLITDNKKLLEETTFNIREEIKGSFEHLINVLKSREKQLLRQVEAVHVQQLSLIQSNLEVVNCKPLLNIDLSATWDIESQILNLGKLEVVGNNGIKVKDTEPYKVEEYQDADRDHESFNKSIKSEYKNEEIVVVGKSIESKEANEINVSTSDESAVGNFNDGNLSCSCDSSFDLNVESENRSDQDRSVLSPSNCTVIYRPIIVPDNERSTKIESIDSDSSSLDLINDNSKTSLNKIGENSHVDSQESYSNNTISNDVPNSNFHKDINANKEQDLSKDSPSIKKACKNGEIRRDSGEHPKQIQQWLQEILVETETEPMIHEIEQFSEISKARLSGQFPLET